MQITRAERFRLWLPAVVWAAMILILSGSGGSSQSSGSLLRLILPPLEPEVFEALNFGLRKLSHVVAYAVLSLLNSRALGGRRRVLAVILAVVVAVIDEVRQSWTPSRSGHVLDVLLDTAAASVAQMVVSLRKRRYP